MSIGVSFWGRLAVRFRAGVRPAFFVAEPDVRVGAALLRAGEAFDGFEAFVVFLDVFVPDVFERAFVVLRVEAFGAALFARRVVFATLF